MRPLIRKMRKIKNKITLGIKYFLYSTLTEENLAKIIKRKNEEIEGIDEILKYNLEKSEEAFREDILEYFSEEDVDWIVEQCNKKEGELK